MSLPLPHWMDWQMYGRMMIDRWLWMILSASLSAAWRQPSPLLTKRSPCVSLTLLHLLIKALLSLVTSCHLCLFVFAVSSCTFCPFPCDSAVPLDWPPRVHGNKENSQAASVFYSDWHPIIVSRSLFHCYFSPGSFCLPLSDKVGLWQLG